MAKRSALIALLFLAAWGVRTRLVTPHPADYDGSLSTFPAVVGSWTGQDIQLDQEILDQLKVDDYLNRYYRTADRRISLYVAYYASQQEGDAVHSPMNCLPGSGWQPITTERINLETLAGNRAETINKVVIVKGIDQQLVLYWYQTLDRVVASEYLSKALLVKDAFRSGRTDIALVRIVAPIDSQSVDGGEKAMRLARPFAEHVLPEVRKRLFRS